MLAHDLQQVRRRLVICGMHVHVGIEDDELRIDLLGQAAYFLPHLLALSTSSPFRQGRRPGSNPTGCGIRRAPAHRRAISVRRYSEYDRSIEFW